MTAKTQFSDWVFLYAKKNLGFICFCKIKKYIFVKSTIKNNKMKTKQITELHERAALILERINDMESIIEIHNHNLQIYNGWFGDTLTKSETRKIERRELAISKLWKLYNEAITEIKFKTCLNK